ncbi:MAG: hypothetical protein AAFV43_05480 [Planctomycetota bacterium]
MTTLRVTMIDQKPVVFLPPELADRLGVVEGSELVFDEGALRPSDAIVDAQVDLMTDVMRRRRDVLRRLAE